jgi:DinB superfamily
MQGNELYADLIASLVEGTRGEVEKLSPQELAWQPDAEGNSIGVTVWHVARWLDVVARVFQEKPAEDELWLTQGWAKRTGYNPRGVGYRGLGALTGYTQQEVAAIPTLSAEELLAYLDQASGALRAYLLALPSFEALLQPVPGWGKETPVTKDQLLKVVFMGCAGHLGEIKALKAMMKRAQVA